MLDELALNAGRIDACGLLGDAGWSDVTHYTEQLARWRHPSSLAGLLGGREEYLQSLQAEAAIRFQAGQQEGYPSGSDRGRVEEMVGAGVQLIEVELGH